MQWWTLPVLHLQLSSSGAHRVPTLGSACAFPTSLAALKRGFRFVVDCSDRSARLNSTLLLSSSTNSWPCCTGVLCEKKKKVHCFISRAEQEVLQLADSHLDLFTLSKQLSVFLMSVRSRTCYGGFRLADVAGLPHSSHPPQAADPTVDQATSPSAVKAFILMDVAPCSSHSQTPR